MEQTNEEIAQTLHEMETVFVDGEKAHTDAILRARMREAHSTLQPREWRRPRPR